MAARRRFRPRRGEAAPAPRAAADRPRAGRAGAALVLALLAGYWIGRSALVLPADALQAADIAAALLSAALLAIWWRRRARRWIGRRGRAAPRGGPTDREGGTR